MSGRAVGPDFRLPWSHRTMADVFAERAEKARKGDKAKAAKQAPKLREQFVRERMGAPMVRANGKLAYAGYDGSEIRVRAKK